MVSLRIWKLLADIKLIVVFDAFIHDVNPIVLALRRSHDKHGAVCQYHFSLKPMSCQCVSNMVIPIMYNENHCHYGDVIMGAIASQITSLKIVYSTVYSDADQRKHQSSASLAFVWGIHRGPMDSPHKWPVTLKMFLFDDVIMSKQSCVGGCPHPLLQWNNTKPT